jgi:hypothetical protein
MVHVVVPRHPAGSFELVRPPPRRLDGPPHRSAHRPRHVPPRPSGALEQHSRYWPAAPDNADTDLGHIRTQLIEAYGTSCYACRQSPGVHVDDDPFTTRVRGVLCRDCNATIDTCPHLAGCPWADYIKDPPAAPLNLVHPNWRKILERPSTRCKIQALGLDPFAHLRAQDPSGRNWTPDGPS